MVDYTDSFHWRTWCQLKRDGFICIHTATTTTLTTQCVRPNDRVQCYDNQCLSTERDVDGNGRGPRPRNCLCNTVQQSKTNKILAMVNRCAARGSNQDHLGRSRSRHRLNHLVWNDCSEIHQWNFGTVCRTYTLLPPLAIIRAEPESVILPSWAGNELKAAMQYLGSLGIQFQLNVRALT
jgi:hypothetical protein